MRGSAGHKHSRIRPATLSSGRLKLSASRAPAGQHTLIGMYSNALTSDSKPHTTAKAETMGCGLAFHRAFDSHSRYR
jgi:hypothetical protein